MRGDPRQRHIFGRGEHSYTRPRTENVLLLHAFVCGRRVYRRRSSGYCQLDNQAWHRGIPSREALRIIYLEGARISGLRKPGTGTRFFGFLHRAWVKVRNSRLNQVLAAGKVLGSSVPVGRSDHEQTQWQRFCIRKLNERKSECRYVYPGDYEG